jgi:hypothetical protein
MISLTAQKVKLENEFDGLISAASYEYHDKMHTSKQKTPE